MNPDFQQSNISPLIINEGTPSGWISSAELSNLAGISSRSARSALSKAAEGRSWRGAKLIVRSDAGAGGRSGRILKLNPHSLPTVLRNKWLKENPELGNNQVNIQVLETGVRANPERLKNSKIQHWRLEIIQPALAYKKGTSARSDSVKKIAEKDHKTLSGKSKQVAESTLYNWLSAYEDNGIAGLAQKTRSNKGKSLVVISRKFDADCPLSLNEKLEVSDRLQRYVQSLWASGVPGWRKASRFSTSKLIEICKEYGWNDATESVCKVPRGFVENEREYSLVAIHDKDAKKFFDKFLPRIKRNRDGIKPQGVIVGDVHPIDIAVLREDGTKAYPRAIAWQCIATNRLYITLILLEKNEGVSRKHVAMSFAGMCQNWGLPEILYLDNGSEYNWQEMMDGFMELSKLSGEFQLRFTQDNPDVDKAVKELRNEIIRARPYNAPAKPIEGLFGVLEGSVLSMLPGWVGGNRMKKKTHNVGKEPLPFQGSWEDFHQAFETALRYYHTQPQEGTLNGNSPVQAYRTFIDHGWVKTAVAEKALLVSFAKEEIKIPDRGYIQWEGATYYHDDLLPYTGQKITTKVAFHDPKYLFAFKDEILICAAEPAETFGFLNTDGAKEQGRRKKALSRVITGRRQDVDRLDLVREMERDNQHRPAMPEAPTGKTVQITEQAQQMLEVLDRDEDQKVDEVQQRRDSKQLSQWSSENDDDPYLNAVNFDE